MKIINRTQFLAMPEGTVYSKFEPCFFGEISIKGESVANDWWHQPICDAIKAVAASTWRAMAAATPGNSHA